MYNPLDNWVSLKDLPDSVKDKVKIYRSTTKQGLVLNTPQIVAEMAAINQEPEPQGPAPMLILLDFRTFCYPIALDVEKWENKHVEAGLNLPMGLFDACYLKWIRTLTDSPQELINLASVMQGGTDDPQFQIVIVDDFPDTDTSYSDPDKAIYWRHRHCPDYKAGRKSKPSSWDILTKAGYAAASALNLPIVRERWMEADDLIAQFVRDREAYEISALAIWTVDTDLLQLVTSEAPKPVVWYNTPYPPCYRDEQTAIKYWLKRWRSTISHPREIAAYKAKNGDSSDNLPPGVDIGIIDLFNPLEYPRNKYHGALLYPPKVLSEWKKINQQARIESMIAGLGVA
jgi:hypothetical protein